MKSLSQYIYLGGALLALSGPAAFAQRAAPTREERREGRQQANENLTPEQRRQNMEARFQERFNAASPEQRERMTQMRRQMQERMQQAGIDPNDPNAFQKMREAGVFNGPGQEGQGGQGGQADPGQGGGFERQRPAAQAAPPPMTREEARRQLMNAAGITDRNVQFAILAFANRQDQARAPILKLAQDAAMALVPPKPSAAKAQPVVAPAPRAEVSQANQLVTDASQAQPVASDGKKAPSAEDAAQSAFLAYENAIAAERKRYQTALVALDKEIKYSTNPRLKAFLTLAGILDFDPLALGGTQVIFTPAIELANAPDPAEEALRVARESGVVDEQGLPTGFGRSRTAETAAPTQEDNARPAGFGRPQAPAPAAEGGE